MTILVAEDSAYNFQIMEKMLKSTGVSLMHAKDGQEAVDLFLNAKRKPDLLLLDIKMPKLSGVEALNEIRKEAPGIPAIAQTAHALSSEIQEILKSGFQRCVTKPIQWESLFNEIASELELK